MNIGMNIKKIREEKNMSMSYLADKLKISKSTISRYESGKREPNIETLKKIASILDTSLEELLKDTPISLGANIRKYRKLKGFSIKDLSLQIDKPISEIKEYEADKVMPDNDTINIIAVRLDVPVNTLTGISENFEEEEEIYALTRELDIGKIIKENRLKNELTLEALAKALNTSISRIECFESNNLVPSVDEITKISSLFNLSVTELIGHDLQFYIDKVNSECYQLAKKINNLPKIELEIYRKLPSQYMFNVNKAITLNDFLKCWSNLNNDLLNNCKVSESIGLNEALIGLKLIMSFWSIPWKKYNEEALTEMLFSNVLRTLIKNVLDSSEADFQNKKDK